MNATFDNTITLGAIIQTVLLIAAVIGFYWSTRELIFKLHHDAMEKIQALHLENSERLSVVETRLATIWKWFTERMERRDQDRL